jgi:hypothetical protein
MNEQAKAAISLRLPDEAAKKAAFGEFVTDLKFAWKLAS